MRTLSCLNFPFPLLLTIPRAADESQNTTPFLVSPKSFAILHSPNNSADNFLSATNSASPELRVTCLCVFAHPFRKCVPAVTAPPLVDLPVTRHPAQSESEYPSKSVSQFCHSYLNIVLLHPFKYLASLFNFFHPPTVGAAIHLHISFVAYIVSGLSNAK